MSEWEEIFRGEIRKFTFGRADPEKLSKYLIVALGVRSKIAERKLGNQCKVGPAVVGEFCGRASKSYISASLSATVMI